MSCFVSAYKSYCVGASGIGEMGGTFRSMERMRLRLGVDVGQGGSCLQFHWVEEGGL